MSGTGGRLSEWYRWGVLVSGTGGRLSEWYRWTP